MRSFCTAIACFLYDFILQSVCVILWNALETKTTLLGQNIQKTKQVSCGYQVSDSKVKSKPYSSWIIPYLHLRFLFEFWSKNFSVSEKSFFCLSAVGLEESRHSVDPGGKQLNMSFPEMAFSYYCLDLCDTCCPLWWKSVPAWQIPRSLVFTWIELFHTNHIWNSLLFLCFLFLSCPQKLQHLGLWIKV